MVRLRTAAWPVISLCLAPPQVAGAVAKPGLTVLSGQFGTLRYKRKLDITARLQQLCGAGSDRCDVFCSETSFGLYRLGPKPICRVTYRCPTGATRSVEAAREEPIMLRCDEEEAAALAPHQVGGPRGTSSSARV